MRYHRSREGTQAHPKLFSITVESLHELKDVASVIRVALSSVGEVKEIKVIPAETTGVPSDAEENESSER